MNFSRIATGTRTDLALEMANTYLLSVEGGERDDKPNILIVITDGRTNTERSQPYPEVLKPLQVRKMKGAVSTIILSQPPFYLQSKVHVLSSPFLFKP